MTRLAVVVGWLGLLVGASAVSTGPSHAAPSAFDGPSRALPAASVTRRPTSVELRVFAAASLHEAFVPLGALLERRHPGLRVRFNFAGSQQLVAQLQQGAAADVFAPADLGWMARAREHGLVADSSVEFARNRLVIVVPSADPGHVRSPADLARKGVKLVLGAAAVPVGHYARDLLMNLSREPGFPADYSTLVMRNVASEEENVTSVLGKVRLGEVDAGIVYASDVQGDTRDEVRVLEVPASANVIASYPIAVLRDARSPALAREFMVLARSAEGRRALERAGFLPPADAGR